MIVPITVAAFLGLRIYIDVAWTKKDIPGVEARMEPWRDGALRYFVEGDPKGVRVIYVHGTPGAASNWSGYVRDPVMGTQSLAYDRPGFGGTKPHRAVPSLKEQAAAIELFLVERDGQWPILVGHSLGGPIVAQAAIDYPDRVGGIVLAAGSFDPGLEEVYWIQQFGDWPLVRLLLPRILRNGNRELLQLEDELRQLQQKLPHITCPVVIVHGTNDRLVKYDNVQFMKAHIPQPAIADVITLDPGNHFLIWNADQYVRQAIRRLLPKSEMTPASLNPEHGAAAAGDANPDVPPSQ